MKRDGNKKEGESNLEELILKAPKWIIEDPTIEANGLRVHSVLSSNNEWLFAKALCIWEEGSYVVTTFWKKDTKFKCFNSFIALNTL